MAPTIINPNALRSLDIPKSANAAMLLAAKRALSEAGPDVLRTAARGLLVSRASLAVTADAQKITLGVIAAYAVGIAILWDFPKGYSVLWPFKMLTIAFHEAGHAVAAKLTGGKVESVSLSPKEGGETKSRGGSRFFVLPSGYLGSSLVGALLTFCGFDIVASKIASLVVGPVFLLLLWWGRKDWLTIGTVLAAVGLLVAGWFIADAEALRYIILFIGVMSSLYSAWDIRDDLISRVEPRSDAWQFADKYGGSSVCWGVIWLIISLCFLAAAIVSGIAAFPQTTAEQRQDSDDFIPT